MLALWLDDLESLEAISQDADARRFLLRMAALAHGDRTPSLVTEIARDHELDDPTKLWLTELAHHRSLPLAVEQYLVLTHRVH